MRRVIICPHCSNQLQALSLSCGHCGRAYRNRQVAAGIAMVAGVLGAHRFYLKSWVLGATYVAASVTALAIAPKAIALVAAASILEGAVFLVMPETSWRRTYGRSALSGARG